DDLVLDGGDAQRSHPPIGFRDVRPPGGRRPIAPVMDAPMQVLDLVVDIGFVLLPRDAIAARGRVALERVEAPDKQRDVKVMQQGGEPRILVPASDFAHSLQAGRHVGPALCRGRGRLPRVPLSWWPSLHRLRRSPTVVRRLPRYYAAIRLPRAVHVGVAGCALSRPIPRRISEG